MLVPLLNYSNSRRSSSLVSTMRNNDTVPCGICKNLVKFSEIYSYVKIIF